MKRNPEYETFTDAMDKILHANPGDVKAAMEAEKKERAIEQQRTGKRGRGRPPKRPLASSRASSEKD
jgi:hypothetical protein